VLPDFFRRIGGLMDGVNDRERSTMLKLLEKVRSRKSAFGNGASRATETQSAARAARSVAA
jgi:hypothetical protein